MRVRRFAACLVVTLGLLLAAYTYHALGSVSPEYLLVFHGNYWLFLLGIPGLLIAGGLAAFGSAPDSKIRIAAVIIFTLVALYVAIGLISLFHYMSNLSQGL